MMFGCPRSRFWDLGKHNTQPQLTKFNRKLLLPNRNSSHRFIHPLQHIVRQLHAHRLHVIRNLFRP